MRAGKKAGKSQEEEEREMEGRIYGGDGATDGNGKGIWVHWCFLLFHSISALYWLLLFIGRFLCVFFLFFASSLFLSLLFFALPCAYSFYLLFAATGLLGIGVGIWVLHGTMSVASSTFSLRGWCAIYQF